MASFECEARSVTNEETGNQSKSVRITVLQRATCLDDVSRHSTHAVEMARSSNIFVIEKWKWN